jgi:hypothetical protein
MLSSYIRSQKHSMDPIVLKHCQVFTPLNIVEMMWGMARARRAKFDTVLDLGAGDGRFSIGAVDAVYVGYEIDKTKIPLSQNKNVDFVNRDVLECDKRDYSLSIGNPPYIRKELIDPIWRSKAISLLKMESGGIVPRADANAFVYFLWLSLLRTHSEGLVVQLVPFEWVNRPSALPLRKFIRENGWGVEVYRFSEDIFDRVLTTAAIVVIDKAQKTSEWRYFTLNTSGERTLTATPTGGDAEALDYSNRNDKAYALRGLSPGGQEIYVLTEEERRFQGLEIGTDVTPCVTTLRHVDADQLALTDTLFQREFVQAGNQCWLIRSDREHRSSALNRYLVSVKDAASKYSTNTVRGEDWFKFRAHPVPDLIVASGFRNRGPKSFINQANVITLGSVYAVFVKAKSRHSDVVRALRNYDFESQVVSHSNGLRKIEVKQLNSVLSQIVSDRKL